MDWSGQDQSTQCCQDILNLYPRITQLYQDCPPEHIILGDVIQNVQCFLEPVYARLKCRSVFCCQGLVEAIFEAVKGYFYQDPVTPGQFYLVLRGILELAGFPVPTGSITIVKQLDPLDDPGTFNFYLNGLLVASGGAGLYGPFIVPV